MTVSRLEAWRAGVRATLARFEDQDPERPPEGMAAAEWAKMLDGFKASCRRLLASNMDSAPSDRQQRHADAKVGRMVAKLDRGLTDRGSLDA